MTEVSPFICPHCRSPLDGMTCQTCSAVIPEIDGIALLVKDRSVIDAAIEEAKSGGRASWYEKPHERQWRGPYRHHLRRRRRYVGRVVSAFVRDAGRPLVGLDIGCGDGMHLAWLRGHVDDLYASDYNIERLARAARQQQAKRVVMADVTDYPMRDESVDIVFFNHVLEHIKDDEKALAEVYRILKPGGLVVLGTPNEGVAFWQLAYRLQPRMLRTSDHVQFYTAESLAAKCRSVGFSVDAIKHIGYGVPHWTLDAGLRQFKVLDDLFELVGGTFVPRQATSLYLSLRKR